MVGDKGRGVTTPDNTVLRCFTALPFQLHGQPLPKTANLRRCLAGAVELSDAEPRRYSVLVVRPAHDRRVGNEAEGREARPRLVNAGRTGRALCKDESEGFVEPNKALDRGQTA